jgi:hypothetical protein
MLARLERYELDVFAEAKHKHCGGRQRRAANRRFFDDIED